MGLMMPFPGEVPKMQGETVTVSISADSGPYPSFGLVDDTNRRFRDTDYVTVSRAEWEHLNALRDEVMEIENRWEELAQLHGKNHE